MNNWFASRVPLQGKCGLELGSRKDGKMFDRLEKGDRLTLSKSTLSSLRTYFLSLFKILPKWKIDWKFTAGFLMEWDGRGVQIHLVGWKLVLFSLQKWRTGY
jgi:hypothetical protein